MDKRTALVLVDLILCVFQLGVTILAIISKEFWLLILVVFSGNNTIRREIMKTE